MYRTRGLRAALSRYADGREYELNEVVAAIGHLIAPQVAARAAGRFRGRHDAQVWVGRCRRIWNALYQMGAQVTRKEGHTTAAFRLEQPASGPRRGERLSHARWTDAQVLELRRRFRRGGISTQELAEECGVSATTLSAALLGRNWAHVPEAITRAEAYARHCESQRRAAERRRDRARFSAATTTKETTA